MTIISVHTRATAQNGNFTCEASTENASLILRGHSEGMTTFSLAIDSKDILSIISVLGDAYDWRKHKMAEKT